MNFDGIFFISCFLPVVLAAYWLIPGIRVKNVLLLVFGLLFYAFGSLTGLALLVLGALATWALGLGIQSGKNAKLWLILGVAGNLLFLGVYKYLDFVLRDLLHLPQLTLGLMAPVGISFFTFKCISYLMDTHRNKEAGTKNFFELLLYISFFPQVMAGPISRFGDFRGQLEEREMNLNPGLRRFIVGLAKKLLLAGTLGGAADKVFALEAGVLDARLAWLGAVAYMLQIYFDFSGYSDMAIGIGNLFGFQTGENFDHPYVAASIGDFWRRWHISLSSWFRDYLYIPLGGNRKGATRAALNKAIVFTLCGLWHGAAWTFLLWGFWHGLLSALESLGIIPVKAMKKTAPGRALGHIYTLLAVCLGFVMFRAETLGQGFAIIGAMFTGFETTNAGMIALRSILTGEAVAALVGGAVLALPVKAIFRGNPLAEKASYAACLVLFVLCLARLAAGGFTPFIYFQF